MVGNIIIHVWLAVALAVVMLQWRRIRTLRQQQERVCDKWARNILNDELKKSSESADGVIWSGSIRRFASALDDRFAGGVGATTVEWNQHWEYRQQARRAGINEGIRGDEVRAVEGRTPEEVNQ